jgi:hypothetical protein
MKRKIQFYAMFQMYTDSYFLYPLNWSVTLEAAAGNKQVYMYYFTYIGTASNSVLYGDTQHAYGNAIHSVASSTYHVRNVTIHVI